MKKPKRGRARSERDEPSSRTTEPTDGLNFLPALQANVESTQTPPLPGTPGTPAPDEWLLATSRECYAKLWALKENTKLGSEVATRNLLLVAVNLVEWLRGLYERPTEAMRKYVPGLLTLPIGDCLDAAARKENVRLMRELGLGKRLAIKKPWETGPLPRRVAGQLWFVVNEHRTLSSALWTQCPKTHRARLFKNPPEWYREAMELPPLLIGEKAEEIVVRRWFSVCWKKLIHEAQGEPEKHSELMELGRAGWVKYRRAYGKEEGSPASDRTNLLDKAKDKLSRAFFALFGLKYTRDSQLP